MNVNIADLGIPNRMDCVTTAWKFEQIGSLMLLGRSSLDQNRRQVLDTSR